MKKKIFVVLLTVAMALSLVACEDKSSTEPKEDKKAESNTSAKVDEILLEARNDAEKLSDEEATAKWEEAFDYLKAHADNFYESNETMEKSMYYGEFLYRYIEANANASDVSQLEDSTRVAYDAGYNTVKAIKYVYRDAATQEDEDTKNALTEAQTALSKFK